MTELTYDCTQLHKHYDPEADEWMEHAHSLDKGGDFPHGENGYPKDKQQAAKVNYDEPTQAPNVPRDDVPLGNVPPGATVTGVQQTSQQNPWPQSPANQPS